MKNIIILFLFAVIFLSCKNKATNIALPNKDSSNKYDSLEASNTKSNFILGKDIYYQTPYYVFKGKETNPVVIIDGGIHGDEISGYMSCDTLAKYLKVSKGTVYIIPRLNINACKEIKRGLKNDFNRSFPGDKNAVDYEFRLAYDFMNFVDSLKPVCVINNHEARTKYDANEYRKNPDKAFGQVLITCISPSDELLIKSLANLNSRIKENEFLFNIQYYPIQPNHSLDNIEAKLNTKSYTVETYRGYKLEERIKMHIMADLSFLEESGIKFEYPNIKLK
ncbi:MAG: succinylglutamate desuccinylase/aspartoacylase family protein [Ignavibacteriae bacterium]|nr:succinylglutamate desuccinylase/aspartoacylase family protein [Ignavibacteriota bacterium]